MTRKKTVNERLSEAFRDVFDKPTDKNIREYKKYEEALLASWLKELFSSLSKGIDKNIEKGSSEAVKQLIKKGFKGKDEKNSLIKKVSAAMKERLKSDLEKVVSGVKSTSRNMIVGLQEEQITEPQPDKYSWKKVFLAYGVAYFTDKGGRIWSLDRYTKMLKNTSEYAAYRDAMFAKSIEYGNDLVRIIHNGNEAPCDICEPFQGKVLSINGKTKGYLTVEEAKSYGLFHINCYCRFELAPQEPSSGNGEIVFSEANEKQRARFERGNSRSYIGQEHEHQNKPLVMKSGEIVLNGSELGDFENIKELRQNAIKYYNQNYKGSFVRRRELGFVSFSRKGIMETLSKGSQETKIKIIPTIQEIITKGKVLPEKPLEHARKDDFTSFVNIVSKVKIEGKTYEVGVYLGKSKKGFVYYDLFLK